MRSWGWTRRRLYQRGKPAARLLGGRSARYGGGSDKSFGLGQLYVTQRKLLSQVDMKKRLTDKDKAGGTGKVGGTGKIRSESRQLKDAVDVAIGGSNKSKPGWLGFMSKDKPQEEDSEDDDDDDNGYEEAKKSKLSLMALISGKR